VFSFRRKLDPNKPIGALGSVDGWKTLSIKECGEPLVPLGPFSPYRQIATDAIYFGAANSSPYPMAKLDGALVTIFVREGIANRLARATTMLPPGFMILVWDAYRTLSVQKALFDYFVEVLRGRGLSHEQAIEDAQKFVSIPSDDPSKAPPHNTGGAVDLTLIRFTPAAWKRMRMLTKAASVKETADNWRGIFKAEMERLQLIRQAELLDMGTVFDEVLPQTETCYYEGLDERQLTAHERKIRDNRRLLHQVMAAVGLSNYPAEWWHYDGGNQFAAARTGEGAIYGPATFSSENEEHEAIRRGHHFRCVNFAEGRQPRGKIEHEFYPFVRDVVAQTGNLRHTTQPMAAAI